MNTQNCSRHFSCGGLKSRGVGGLGCLRCVRIATHLNQGVRTVQRWEILGLPVHRMGKGRRAPVTACAEELDAWQSAAPRRLLEEIEDLKKQVTVLQAEVRSLRGGKVLPDLEKLLKRALQCAKRRSACGKSSHRIKTHELHAKSCGWRVINRGLQNGLKFPTHHGPLFSQRAFSSFRCGQGPFGNFQDASPILQLWLQHGRQFARPSSFAQGSTARKQASPLATACLKG